MRINSSVLLIGRGRLAQHLKYWNSLLENPNSLLQWDRTQKTETLNFYLGQCNLVWLAISDTSLIEFYENHIQSFNIKTLHFSGALNDARMLCAHPMMSFPKALLPVETYRKIHFIINGFENLTEALPSFNNNFSILNQKNKSLYHALCVMAGNFPQMLWSEVAKNLNELEVPPQALDIYIRQITENYLNLKEQALTGPLVRNDQKTISNNIFSLEKNTQLKNIYTCFNKEFNT